MEVNVFRILHELKENIPQEMKGKFDDWAFFVMFVRMFALE
jgi:hypothetical protein